MAGEGEISEDGMDLFRELLRYYPLAKLKVYYQHGRWNKRQILTDTQLISAHREEAGAAPPLDLEDVPVPELPSEVSSSSVSHRRGPGPPTVPPMRRPEPPPNIPRSRGPPMTPAPPKEAPPARAFAAQGVDHRPIAGEARMIANFTDKWGLDSTRTKLMFSRLMPAKRQMVLETFPGGGADELRQYIARCERENNWSGSRYGGTKRGPSPAPDVRNMRARTDTTAAARSAVYSREPPPSAKTSRTPEMSSAAEAYKQRAVAARAAYGVQREPPPRASAVGARGSAGAPNSRAQEYEERVARRPVPARNAPKPTNAAKSTPTPTAKPSERPGDLIKNLLGNLGL